MIVHDEIATYLKGLVPERSLLLAELERQAELEGIPIIQVESARLLRVLLLAHRPKRILEIGTAIGYSTIWLAEAAPEARIVTLELDEERAARARANFQAAGVADRVELLLCDATTGLPGDRRFDCLFIDAAKGQYQRFLDLYLPLVEEGGMVICDNVLFRGWVAAPEKAGKRLRPMAEKLRRFNQSLVDHPELETVLLPVGDGVAVSVKRSGRR